MRSGSHEEYATRLGADALFRLGTVGVVYSLTDRLHGAGTLLPLSALTGDPL